MAKILVLDDEPVFLTSLALILEQEGFDVRTAGDGTEARAATADWLPDVVVADWMLRDGEDGIDVTESLRRGKPDLKLILITGYATKEVRRRLEKSAEGRLLEKPFLPEQLLALVRECTD